MFCCPVSYVRSHQKWFHVRCSMMSFQCKKITVYQQRHKPNYIWLQTINEVFFVYAIVRLRLEHLQPITSGFQWHRILLHNQEIAKLANKSTSNEIWSQSQSLPRQKLVNRIVVYQEEKVGINGWHVTFIHASNSFEICTLIMEQVFAK